MGIIMDWFLENIPASNKANQRTDNNNYIAFRSGYVTLGGTSFFTGSGTPKSVVTPVRVGDEYTDYTNGNIWLATGTTNTSWVLIDSILSGNGLAQTAIATYTTAQLNTGISLVPATASHTITPLYWKILVNGTFSGGTNLLIQDTSAGTVIATITEAALATAASGYITSDTQPPVTGVTNGAGMMAALTAGRGIQLIGTGTLAGGTGVTVVVEYLVA